MSFETWAAFVLASAIVLVVPGPTVIVVVTAALGRGRRAALPLAAGVVLGYSSSIAVAAIGLGTSLASSQALFAALQVAGGAFLVWRGAVLWRSGDAVGVPPDAPAAGGLLRRVWIVTALNPIAVAFHLAFLPRFVDVAGDPWRQVAVLGATFLVLGFVNALAYALAAATLGRRLGSSRAAGLLVRTGAAGLIGIGIWAALSVA